MLAGEILLLNPMFIEPTKRSDEGAGSVECSSKLRGISETLAEGMSDRRYCLST
jgi:hypothetical protein